MDGVDSERHSKNDRRRELHKEGKESQTSWHTGREGYLVSFRAMLFIRVAPAYRSSANFHPLYV